VKRGDTFIVTTRPGGREDGGIAWQFTVLGVVDDPKETVDWIPNIYGNYRLLRCAETFAQARQGLVHRVYLGPCQGAVPLRRHRSSYANSGAPTYCVPLREDARQVASSILNMRQMSLGIASAGLFMILFLCANSTAESVRERLPEFAVLKTIGFGDGAVATVVFLEAALPTVAGALLGTALAWLLGTWPRDWRTRASSISRGPPCLCSFWGWRLQRRC